MGFILDVEVTTKHCRGCGITRPVTEFGKHPETRDRLRSRCRTCARAAWAKKHGPSTRNLDFCGRRFGRLVVVGLAPQIRKGDRRWICRCDCGTEKPVGQGALVWGNTVSCGCKRRDTIPKVDNTRHGHAANGTMTPEYTAHQNMLGRCYNPGRRKTYARYGGRGITVCDRWRYGECGVNGFECFLGDMGPRPSSRHSVERLDNDRGYSPSNCVWALRIQQANNTSRNRFVMIDGQPQLLRKVCEARGISLATIYYRMRGGLSAEEAIALPIRRQRRLDRERDPR